MKTILKNKDILLLHAYGQSTFNAEEIRKYGSVEALIGSDILQGVPNREKSLNDLWAVIVMLQKCRLRTRNTPKDM